MSHSFSNKSKWTSPRDSKWAFSPREPGPPPGRACQHGSRVTSIPGHPLHCPRHCLLQKYTSSGESEHAFHSITGRKTLQEKKNACHADKYIFLLMLAHPLCAKGFFLPEILFHEINGFFS
jgi:hypothetical protein